jgi:hypothetical protein
MKKELIKTSKICNYCGVDKPLEAYAKRRCTCRKCFYEKHLKGNPKAIARNKMYRKLDWLRRGNGYEYHQAYRKKNKAKFNRHSILYTMIKRGTIIKPDKCQCCGFPTTDLHCKIIDWETKNLLFRCKVCR